MVVTVQTAKEYLDAELAKYETWEAAGDFAKGITDDEHFYQLKKNGVGRTTIQKFLGGNWQ